MKRRALSFFPALALAGAVLPSLPGSARGEGAGAPPDSAAVAAVVQAFHQALQDRDDEAVRSLLAPDVLVLENGGLETRAEYLSHHLSADMEFASAVRRTPGEIHVTVGGDVAWAVSTFRATGTFRGRSVDSLAAELMVLTWDGEGWRIRSIHWSSRPAS